MVAKVSQSLFSPPVRYKIDSDRLSEPKEIFGKDNIMAYRKARG
jgi:hypothetical protein